MVKTTMTDIAMGRALQATMNLLLAMNGEPEPAPDETVFDVAKKMDLIATTLRLSNRSITYHTHD